MIFLNAVAWGFALIVLIWTIVFVVYMWDEGIDKISASLEARGRVRQTSTYHRPGWLVRNFELLGWTLFFIVCLIPVAWIGLTIQVAYWVYGG